MSTASEQISKLCSRTETKKRAQQIHQIARIRTRPGSGFDIGQSVIGLPAICSYIATQDLQNNDVQKSVAQAAACLNPREFERCLKIIRSAIDSDAANTSPDARRSGRLNSDSYYEELVQKTGIPVPCNAVISWLKKAERDLLIHSGQQFDTRGKDVKIGVFIWVYDIIRALKSEHLTSSDQLLKELKVNIALVQEVVSGLEKSRSSFRAQIESNIERLNAGIPLIGTPMSSPRKSPSKRPARELLVGGGSTPQKQRIADGEGQTPTAGDDEDIPTPPESPTKKRKTADVSQVPSLASKASSSRVILDSRLFEASASPQKALVGQQLSNPSRITRQTATPSPEKATNRSSRSLRSAAAASPKILYQKPPQISPQKSSPRRAPAPTPMDVDEQEQSSSSEDEGDEDGPVSRFRPIYHDHMQWTSRDPRTKTALKRVAASKAIIPLLERYRPRGTV